MLEEIEQLQREARTDPVLQDALTQAITEARQQNQEDIQQHRCGPGEVGILHGLLKKRGLI